MKHSWIQSFILGFVAAFAIPTAFGDSITIDSGTAVTYLDSGLTSGDFPSAFTLTNFTAAQTGPAASLLSSTPSYLPALPADSAAKWIGTNPSAGTSSGDTALYAVSFDIPDAFISGSLNLFFMVDNELGSSNPGIYLNGVALPSSTGIPGTGSSSFTGQSNYSDANIGADLVQGINWLYFDAVNLGGPAGLIFSADISTVNDIGSAPEPATLWLLGAGLIAMGLMSRRGKDNTATRRP